MFSRRKKSPRPREGHKKNDLSNLVQYISFFFSLNLCRVNLECVGHDSDLYGLSASGNCNDAVSGDLTDLNLKVPQ